jgi:hypothetical protein
MLLWQGRGRGGLVLMGVGTMVIGLVRGVSMRLGGLLATGMGEIRLGIRGEVGDGSMSPCFSDFLFLLINY